MANLKCIVCGKPLVETSDNLTPTGNLGDPIYGTGADAAKGAHRTMLHAAAITVPRDGKPPISATAPLPADFTALGFAMPEPATPEEPDACPQTI